jgi:hypothetical protein
MAEESGPGQSPIDDTAHVVDQDTFEAAYGETLGDALNLDTWDGAGDLAALYQRIQEEVHGAITVEDEIGAEIRRHIFPRLADPTRTGAPPCAGIFRGRPEEIERVHRQALFNGAVEVCDGTSVEHDTLPVTITQIGVCLASYRGSQQSFAHRFFHRDLRFRSGDMMADLTALLDNRSARAGQDDEEQRGRLSTLARRGIMAYAERQVLAQKATAPWRMGHGHPAPYELLTGSGSMELLHQSLVALRVLIEERKRFVFVPSEPSDRRLLTVGYALQPLEYGLIQTAERQMIRIVEGGHYSRPDRALALQFCREVGPQVIIGIYRASRAAPPFIFYSHADHAHEAALIAMADSVLQGHRGFPLLIDLADRLCRSAFGNDLFTDAVQTAYATAGAPFRYLGERQTRG